MVSEKEKEPWPFGHRIGHVRISGPELVNLLQELAGDAYRVTANTKRHSFDSLDDIKANITLLKGSVEVRLSKIKQGFMPSGIEIHFGPSTNVRFSAPSFPGNDKIQLEKVVSGIKSYRLPLMWIFTYIPFMAWMAADFLAVAVLRQNFGNFGFRLTGGALEISLMVAHFSLVVCILISIFLSLTNPVYVEGRATFWRRNRDTIAVGVIMLFIGLFAKELVSYFLGSESQ